MADDIIEPVKQMFEAFQADGNLDRALEFFAEDVEWNSGVVMHEPLHGRAGVQQAFEGLSAQGYKVEATPEHYERIQENVVVASGYVRLMQNDTYTDLPAFWVLVVEDGKIVRGGSATRREEALAATGMSG